MPEPLVCKFDTWEDSGPSLMARITGVDGAAITQASVSAIAYSVFDLGDTTAPTTTGTLTVASVVFDSLQTDARWTKDTIGYNFRWDAPASIFATGGRQYRLELAFTPSSGEVYHLVFEGNVKSLYRS